MRNVVKLGERRLRKTDLKLESGGLQLEDLAKAAATSPVDEEVQRNMRQRADAEEISRNIAKVAEKRAARKKAAADKFAAEKAIAEKVVLAKSNTAQNLGESEPREKVAVEVNIVMTKAEAVQVASKKEAMEKELENAAAAEAAAENAAFVNVPEVQVAAAPKTLSELAAEKNSRTKKSDAAAAAELAANQMMMAKVAASKLAETKADVFKVLPQGDKNVAFNSAAYQAEANNMAAIASYRLAATKVDYKAAAQSNRIATKTAAILQLHRKQAEATYEKKNAEFEAATAAANQIEDQSKLEIAMANAATEAQRDEVQFIAAIEGQQEEEEEQRKWYESWQNPTGEEEVQKEFVPWLYRQS